MSPDLEAEGLLGAYALDALSLEERRRVEAALVADPELREAADLLGEVAAMLAAAAVDDADRAPAGLWARISAATNPVPASRARVSLWRRRLAPALAATALAAAAVLAVVAVRQHARLIDFEESPLAAAAAAARDEAGSVVVALTGRVPAEVILAADGTGYLLAPDAPALTAEETYQLWAIVGDRVISAGVLGPDPEVAAFHVSGEIAGFALTVEVAGGVVSSEQEPVAVGLIEA
ncbi:MAG: anti-sigma factor [Acidimicrobiia bacterium]|nr:anti-sigma factor [Acidimicrobiia bacterium]